MSDGMLNSCKSALSTHIASDDVQGEDSPLEAFSKGIINFIEHYCHDKHTSSWCYHPKVDNEVHNIKTIIVVAD